MKYQLKFSLCCRTFATFSEEVPKSLTSIIISLAISRLCLKEEAHRLDSKRFEISRNFSISLLISKKSIFIEQYHQINYILATYNGIILYFCFNNTWFIFFVYTYSFLIVTRHLWVIIPIYSITSGVWSSSLYKYRLICFDCAFSTFLFCLFLLFI